MKATLGYALVLGGLAFASFGALVGLVSGMRRNDAAFPWVLRCVYGFAACMVGANLVMEWALLTNDFSVQYVAQVGSMGRAAAQLAVVPTRRLEGDCRNGAHARRISPG